MITRTAITHFTIFSLFFLNLPTLLAIIAKDEQKISSSLKDSLIQNETDDNIVPVSLPESDSVIEPSIEVNFEDSNVDSVSEGSTDNTTENSDAPTRIVHNDTPILLSTDSSTVDVEHLAEVSLVLTSQIDEIPPQDTVVQTENIPSNTTQTDIEKLSLDEENEEKNTTEDKSEDIPSFSEWAQKRLEEVEKKEQTNVSTKGQAQNGKGTNAKLRWKNYASLDCGAKVVGANAEAVSPGAILSPAVDEYKLNPCTSRVWFVVELCEAIQAQRIDLANYELFSSSPKDFTVSVSERYPTRDWTLLGKFTAKDERDIQSFDIETQQFGKYIKVEIKSHYGTEHYCPVSLFRAYGMSVFEVIQKEDTDNASPSDDEDDDDDDDVTNEAGKLTSDPHAANTQKNIFSSATDAVISMVKRAAEVLGNKVNNETVLVDANSTKSSTLVNTCTSPRHMIACNNCSETLFGQIYELLSCQSEQIKKLVSIPVIFEALISSRVCGKFGYESTRNGVFHFDSLEMFFPEKYVGAMCNEVAVLEKQGLLNISQQFNNITKSLTTDKIINMEVEDEPQQVELNILDNTSLSGNSTSSPPTTSIVGEDVTQIKPTKTFIVDPNLTRTDLPAEIAIDIESVESLPETTTASYEVTIETPLGVEVDLGGEGVDVLEEHIDHGISDVNGDGQIVAVPSSTTANAPHAPKESIFLRLTNRIKALERNMSLSSQYLEELSRRYKKQVEEMQYLLEKTVATLREETQDRQHHNRELEQRLDQLTATVESLVAERRLLLATFYCLLLVGIVGVVWRGKRRVSVPARPSDAVGKKKKRRPSDQALKIVRYASVDEEERHRRPRKRKKRCEKRSSSVGSLKIEDWAANAHQVIEDVPFLDESDNLTLEAGVLPEDFGKSEPLKVDDTSSVQSVEPCLLYSPNIICNEPVRKEKKGLKRFLRKVF